MQIVWQIVGYIGIFVVVGLIGGFLLDDNGDMAWWERILGTWAYILMMTVILGGTFGVFYGFYMLATGNWVPL